MTNEISELYKAKSWFIEKHVPDLSHPLGNSIKKLLLVSDYACKHVSLINDLLIKDECARPHPREYYFSFFKKIPFDMTQVTYERELRQVRHTHFLRLMLLGLSGRGSIEEIMRSWSDCADALIMHALVYCKHALSSRYGTPRSAEGDEVALLTLGMGKLGGRELNFSSDIDLVFAYTAAGKTDGGECIENQLYFNKVVQLFSQLLQNITPDGFVFRVDLRLRPYGDSGTLVPSLSALETYYQEQGRDWERYAMVKARVLCEDVNEIHPWFQQLIVPFVYRRYVDFSVIESLRSMKAMIEREVQLNPHWNDIKRGKGGIREIEFIIQNIQLIRGGRLPELQQQNALAALAVSKAHGLLHHSTVLKQAYLFLRQLENVLQSVNDQQTHSLPVESIKQAQVLLAMDYTSWNDLLMQLHQYQRIVRYAFRAVMGQVDEYEDEKRVLNNQLASFWQGHIEGTMSINLLASLGFDNAEHCYQMIHAFRHSPRCRRLPQGVRMRLDRFMVMLLAELTEFKKTDEVLLHVIHLLENIVGRSAYLALLTENPPALKELLFVFAHSPMITSLIMNQPFLLEVLLDQGENWKPQTRQQLEKSLCDKLIHHQDIEVREELLRQFKLTQWLIAARAELYGYSNSVRVGKFLSDVAQVILGQVLLIAREQLSVRYPELNKRQAHIAVIAYGKLGSREMNYASDLDLVFLHTAQSADEALVIRLTQKILHMLTMRSQSELLYRVDTRLRPSGSAGLLVCHVDSFVAYQKDQAWTWEHQALLKARIVAGNANIRCKFLQLKKEVVSLPRKKPILQHEIVTMRSKIDHYDDMNSLKHAPGGLLDLEFLVQYLILMLGNADFARSTHTLNQLQHLFALNVLTKDQFKILTKAYRHYHHRVHLELLRPGNGVDGCLQNQVAALYQHFLS